jgi:hypothetical protein
VTDADEDNARGAAVLDAYGVVVGQGGERAEWVDLGAPHGRGLQLSNR